MSPAWVSKKDLSGDLRTTFSNELAMRRSAFNLVGEVAAQKKEPKLG